MKHETDCLICGAPLVYRDVPEERACEQCGQALKTDVYCEKGHFVCDLCHQSDAVEVMREICLKTRETDMLRLMTEIRNHPRFAMHGPEHHAMVPAVILTTYRNLGGTLDDLHLMAGIDRGAMIPGGACGFMGICGAASGVGVAFAILLGSNPLNPEARNLSQKITHEAMGRITAHAAARCCRRESYIALHAAKELSMEHLPVVLQMDQAGDCDQYMKNQECLGAECPLHPQ